MGEAVAVQVVDEPAKARVPLHPAQERHHLRVAQMVGEQRADDDVRSARVGGEHVAHR